MYELHFLKLENNKHPFIEWLNSLDNINKARVKMRLLRIQDGNFGDFKRISEDLFELRLKFGSGYRIYYTIHNNKVIILLLGGDKSTQVKDIEIAKRYLKILKEQ